MNRKTYYIYILTNKRHTVLYVGVTGNLFRRIWQHKQKVNDGFTKRYNVTKLVYYEEYDWIQDAIAREKQLKAGSRQRKLDLINAMNPEWEELYNDLLR